MAYPSEARMLTRYVCRERCLHRCPEQWFADELASRRVNLARPHRFPGSFEHQRYGLKYRANLGWNRPRLTGIDRGLAEQLIVERAEPRELDPGLRV